MYFLMGLKANLENIIILTKPSLKTDFSSLKELEIAYITFLNSLKKQNVKYSHVEPKFVSTLEKSLDLCKIFDIVPVPFELNYITATMHLLQESTYTIMNLDRNLYYLFELAVRLIFCAKTEIPSSQTTNAAIGTIFISPNITWSIFDIIEAFVHELSHTLLFLDAYRYEHFTGNERMRNVNTFALSAIWNKKMPLPLVLHSLIVSAELLLLRNFFMEHGITYHPQLHPHSELLISSSLKSLGSLNHVHFSLMTERMHHLLKLSSQLLESLPI